MVTKYRGVLAVPLLAAALLAGCSGSSQDGTAQGESPSAVVTQAATEDSLVGPIVVEPTQTDVQATVGRSLDFNVGPEPGNWKISSDNEAVVGELTQGGQRDGAMFNPGAKALSAGTATVTLENSEGLEALVFKIQVTQ